VLVQHEVGVHPAPGERVALRLSGRPVAVSVPTP
jgi:hypothetical protein